ncbi:relaxase [Bacteroides uniformis]|uniref:relaxase n=1 Tax=Bacteroides uniformis TaxID=820 RepID=UPI001D096DF8|nr:relaxase [Bacteroides uniformis]MCB6980518.1 relaxase [Bacteroides uniformis]MCB7028327.1 relaxase [Bacteroides uniformis]
MADTISYGANYLNYITGESNRKEHPEKIFHIKDANMPDGLDATAMWYLFKTHTQPFRRLRNNSIAFILSPAKEYTKDFTRQDWADYWDDFVHEFDKLEYYNKKGELVSPKTNIAGTMHTVWIHFDSKGDVPHLHGAACRVDENGHTINDSYIKTRAFDAAMNVARKRGWKTTLDVREENIEQATEDCLDILRRMTKWDWDDYRAMLTAKGYKVCANPDKNGNYHGYALVRGKAKYKASELGKGRNLLYKNLEATWCKLHPEPVRKPAAPVLTPRSQSAYKPVATPSATYQRPSYIPVERYKQMFNGCKPMDITLDGKNYKRYLPSNVAECFADTWNANDVENTNELANLASAIFVGLLSAAGGDGSISSGGGGGQSDLPWRDKDDDDMKWAQRCARYASQKLGIKPKIRSRGFHR